MFLICIMRIAMGSVVCAEMDSVDLGTQKELCVESSKDPLTTCNIVATKDKKRWFFIYSSL